MASERKTVTSSETENPFAPFVELQQSGFGNLMGMNSAWLEGLGDISAEVWSFIADRIKEDVKTQHEILHCKDMAELQQIQSRFMQKAIDQYQAETGKIVEMSMAAFKQNGDAKPKKS